MRRELTVCAGVLLAAFLLVSVISWPIATPLSKYLTPKDEYTEKIEEMLIEVVKDVAKVRMLNAPDSINLKVITVDWEKENWGRKSSEVAIEEVKLDEEIFNALYLIPENFSVVELKEQEAGTITAASAGGTLYVVREYFNPYEDRRAREILAHETTHIIQGINFEIDEPRDFDSKQAKNAFIEGDAGFTTEKYLLYKFNETAGRQFFPPSGNGTLKDREALWQLWVFPYTYGYTFARVLYDEEGWARVNAIYRNMPTSTAEIMHPEKYLSEESFADVKLEKIKGWELKRSDRLGEHFIMIMLARHIPIEKAKLAAEGWAGDKFAYYKENNDYLFLWKIVWDNSKDRNEFLLAFNELLYSIKGEELAPNYWKTYYGYLTVKTNGLNATIIGSSNPDALL